MQRLDAIKWRVAMKKMLSPNDAAWLLEQIHALEAQVEELYKTMAAEGL